MTHDEISYEVGPIGADDSMVGTRPFVIACDGKAVIKHNPNGTAQYMTYKTLRRAEVSLGAVKAALPNAVVHERGSRENPDR